MTDQLDFYLMMQDSRRVTCNLPLALTKPDSPNLDFILYIFDSRWICVRGLLTFYTQTYSNRSQKSV
jgi:hypothetical protein